MKMYIFIDKRFLFKPYSSETCCHLTAIKKIWYIHLSRFLNNPFQNSDYLPTSGKVFHPVHTLHEIFATSTKGYSAQPTSPPPPPSPNRYKITIFIL